MRDLAWTFWMLAVAFFETVMEIVAHLEGEVDSG